MSYTKHTWSDGELVTAAKMNNIENGIEEAASGGGGSASTVLIDIYDDSTPDHLPSGWMSQNFPGSASSFGISTLYAPTSNPSQAVQTALLNHTPVIVKLPNQDSETPMYNQVIGYCQGNSVNWYLYTFNENGHLVIIRYE